jgi:hypothetical protein
LEDIAETGVQCKHCKHNVYRGFILNFIFTLVFELDLWMFCGVLLLQLNSCPPCDNLLKNKFRLVKIRGYSL